MVVVHEENVTVKYTNYGSVVPIIVLLLYFLVILIIPYVIPLLTNKLWMDYSTFTERPLVTFNQKTILFASPLDITQESYKMWTSNQFANTFINPDNLIFPSIQLQASSLYDREENLRTLNVRYGREGFDDANRFDFTIKIPKNPSTRFSNLNVLMEFGMKMKKYRGLEVKGLLHLEKNIAYCSELSVFGEFVLRQSFPFHWTHTATTHNNPIIDFEKVSDINDLEITKILDNAHERDVSGKFVEENSFCKQGLDSNFFTLHLRVKIPVQTYTYEVEWYEKAKFAWIQYFSFVLVIWYIFYQVKRFIVMFGMINTRMIEPNKKIM